MCSLHYLFIGSLTIAVIIRNPVTSQRCFRSLSEIRILPALCIDHDPFLFLSFFFLLLLFLLIFILSPFFILHLFCQYVHVFLFIPSVFSFTTPYFLSIGSPIHLCFIFLPVTVPYNPTALQAHAAPVLSCLPVLVPHTLLFLSFGISVCAACLCTSIFSSVPSRLCLDIKNPLPGSLLQEGIRFPYGSCLLLVVCCSFPIALVLFFVFALCVSLLPSCSS